MDRAKWPIFGEAELKGTYLDNANCASRASPKSILLRTSARSIFRRRHGRRKDLSSPGWRDRVHPADPEGRFHEAAIKSLAALDPSQMEPKDLINTKSSKIGLSARPHDLDRGDFSPRSSPI